MGLQTVLLVIVQISECDKMQKKCVTGPPGALVGIVEPFRWLKSKKINTETWDILKLHHKASLGDTCTLCLLQCANSPDGIGHGRRIWLKKH